MLLYRPRQTRDPDRLTVNSKPSFIPSNEDGTSSTQMIEGGTSFIYNSEITIGATALLLFVSASSSSISSVLSLSQILF